MWLIETVSLHTFHFKLDKLIDGLQPEIRHLFFFSSNEYFVKVSVKKISSFMFCLYSSKSEYLLFYFSHFINVPTVTTPASPYLSNAHSARVPGCCSLNIIEILFFGTLSELRLCNSAPPHHHRDPHDVQGDPTESFQQPPAGFTPPPRVSRLPGDPVLFNPTQ